ncbi:MAG: flotillin-like protein FloA [Planctomycetota bacterium]
MNLLAAVSDNPLWLIGIGFLILIILIFFIVIASFVGLYIKALSSGAKISWISLIGMRLRRINSNLVVESHIAAINANTSIGVDKLQAHYMSRGNVANVVRAVIAANKAGITLTFDRAAAMDLAGRNILDAVNTSVSPKVIDCPDPAKGRETLDAVAMDGIQLKVKARVTVRANLERLVGGATEETIIARVGEGIVSAIGSAESYKQVLEYPDRISKAVLGKGLDSQTAFEIVSIDIADVDVGENIGAKLRVDQAEADKRMAQAEAEKRRALAVAREQEMVALTQEHRAQVVLAEAELPRAMAESFRSGNLGIFDYYRMKNIQSDTGMRDSIARGGAPEQTPPKGPPDHK